MLLVALVVGGVIGLCAAHWLSSLQRPLKQILFGEQRRRLYPVETPIGPGAEAALKMTDVTIKRQLVKLESGHTFFFQMIAPADRPPSHVVVFLHGYTSHSELYVEAFAEVARQGALVVMPDLPAHGRTDGMLGYIPDWWSWVELIWEFMDSVVLPLKNTAGPKPLKVFCAGNSLGGGLTACLAIQRPAFFDGVVLIAPMLFVSDDIKPPLIVQIIFRRLLGPFQLTWPLTPSKATDSFDFRLPSQGGGFTDANPLSMCGLKPRLATALQLGFTFPEWMQEHLGDMRTPFLVLHGTADKVCDPDISKQLHELAPASDKELILYDGAFHCELLCCLPGNAKLISGDFLPEQSAQTKQCLGDIAKWVAARA